MTVKDLLSTLLTRKVAPGNISSMSKRSGTNRVIYGVQEIANAIGENRNMVAGWRTRGNQTHGMPKCENHDQPKLIPSMGPGWLAARIEPWIRQYLEKKTIDAAAEARRITGAGNDAGVTQQSAPASE